MLILLDKPLNNLLISNLFWVYSFLCLAALCLKFFTELSDVTQMLEIIHSLPRDVFLTFQTFQIFFPSLFEKKTDSTHFMHPPCCSGHRIIGHRTLSSYWYRHSGHEKPLYPGSIWLSIQLYLRSKIELILYNPQR